MNFKLRHLILILLLSICPPCQSQDDEPSEPETDPEPTGSEDPPTGDTSDAPSGDDATTSAPAEGNGVEITTCGGILSGQTGDILYKLGEAYDNNERCTWTIYAENANTITFKLSDDGMIQKMEDTIKIGYFRNGEYNKMNAYQEVQLGAFDANKSASVDGPLAFVRFFSDTKIRGMGFRIDYQASNVTTPTTPILYNNQFSTGDHGTIKYTASTSSERATFILKPTVDITLSLKYFNGNCLGKGLGYKDSLSIFKWGRSSRQEFVKELCASPITQVVNWKIAQTEEVMITFMTNTANVTNEFQFIWAPF